jgi:hypothetical protein
VSQPHGADDLVLIIISVAAACLLFSQLWKPIRCIKRVAGSAGVNHLAKLLVLARPVSITCGLGQ